MIVFESKERYKFNEIDIKDIAKSIKTGKYNCTNKFEIERGGKRVKLFNNNNLMESILFLRKSLSNEESILGGKTKMYKYTRLGINYEREGSPVSVENVEKILYKHFNMIDIGNSIKMSLPAFVASVKEYDSYEKNSFIIPNIKELSNFITIDVDHISNVEEIKETIMNNNNFVKFIFTSPKGNGIKIVCEYKTDVDLLKYKRNGKIFKQLWDEINRQIIDKINEGFYGAKVIEMDDDAKDINRLCFLSYDTNLMWRKNVEPLLIEYFEIDGKELYDEDEIENHIKEVKKLKDVRPVYLTNITSELAYLDGYIDWLLYSGVQPFGESNYTAFRNMGFGLIELVKKDEGYKETILNILEKITSFDNYYSNHPPIGRFVETQFENFWNNNSEGITYASVKYYIKNQIEKNR